MPRGYTESTLAFLSLRFRHAHDRLDPLQNPAILKGSLSSHFVSRASFPYGAMAWSDLTGPSDDDPSQEAHSCSDVEVRVGRSADVLLSEAASACVSQQTLPAAGVDLESGLAPFGG